MTIEWGQLYYSDKSKEYLLIGKQWEEPDNHRYYYRFSPSSDITLPEHGNPIQYQRWSSASKNIITDYLSNMQYKLYKNIAPIKKNPNNLFDFDEL